MWLRRKKGIKKVVLSWRNSGKLVQAYDLPADCLVYVSKYYFCIILDLKKTTLATCQQLWLYATSKAKNRQSDLPCCFSFCYLPQTTALQNCLPHQCLQAPISRQIHKWSCVVHDCVCTCMCTPTHHLCSEFYAHRYTGQGTCKSRVTHPTLYTAQMDICLWKLSS